MRRFRWALDNRARDVPLISNNGRIVLAVRTGPKIHHCTNNLAKSQRATDAFDGFR